MASTIASSFYAFFVGANIGTNIVVVHYFLEPALKALSVATLANERVEHIEGRYRKETMVKQRS